MRLTRRSGALVVLLLLSLDFVACATMGDPPPSLYKRLGGRDGIALVVDDFVANMVADPRVNNRFQGMPPPLHGLRRVRRADATPGQEGKQQPEQEGLSLRTDHRVPTS